MVCGIFNVGFFVFEHFVKISSEHMAKYWVGGQACCFDKMTSHLPVVVEQKTIVLQNLGGRLHPLASQVSATGKNTRGLGPESQGFSKFIFEISGFGFPEVGRSVLLRHPDTTNKIN